MLKKERRLGMRWSELLLYFYFILASATSRGSSAKFIHVY
jgi:hypothetical protein